MRHCLILALLTSLTLTGAASAGPFRKKPDPDVRVPALLMVVKTEKDERKRAAAVDELGEQDGKAFPDILPLLVEVLTSDPSSTVRVEAAESIGNLRPISTKAGYALEQAISSDKSLQVRIAARTAIFQYRINGYVGAKLDSAVAQTAEPPLASLTDTVRATPSNALIQPTPAASTAPPSSSMPLPPMIPSAGPRVPANNTSMFPFLNRLNPFSRSTPSAPAPTPVVAKDKSQSAEPPGARPTPPPKKEFNLLDAPPVTPKNFVPPAAVTLPIPKQMPATLTGATKPADDASKPVLTIPAPNAVRPIPTTPTTPPANPTEEGPALGPPAK